VAVQPEPVAADAVAAVAVGVRMNHSVVKGGGFDASGKAPILLGVFAEDSAFFSKAGAKGSCPPLLVGKWEKAWIPAELGPIL